MTVREVLFGVPDYKCPSIYGDDTIEELALHNSDFWEDSNNFLEKVYDRDIESLSPKQRNWVNKINDSYVDAYNEMLMDKEFERQMDKE